MDEITRTLWRETSDLFGKSYEIDICETFIGTEPRKIGQLRTLPNDPQKAHITYNYKVPPPHLLPSMTGRKRGQNATPSQQQPAQPE